MRTNRVQGAQGASTKANDTAPGLPSPATRNDSVGALSMFADGPTEHEQTAGRGVKARLIYRGPDRDGALAQFRAVTAEGLALESLPPGPDRERRAKQLDRDKRRLSASVDRLAADYARGGARLQ